MKSHEQFKSNKLSSSVKLVAGPLCGLEVTIEPTCKIINLLDHRGKSVTYDRESKFTALYRYPKN